MRYLSRVNELGTDEQPPGGTRKWITTLPAVMTSVLDVPGGLDRRGVKEFLT
jgi:hypothetical protein